MKLTKMKTLVLILILISCGDGLPDSYQMDKRFWNIEDYNMAINQIKYDSNNNEGLPRLSDPVTASVFNKLIDIENVNIIMRDDQLGLKYRNEVGQDFFKIANELEKIYFVQDVQDKLIYPVELVKIFEFSLNTQLVYFKVGNDAIIKNAIDESSSEIQNVVQDNIQRLIQNFNRYIEILAKEDAFNKESLHKYASLIKSSYAKLMSIYPNANYSVIKDTAAKISKKVKLKELSDSLNYLIEEIEKNENDIFHNEDI